MSRSGRILVVEDRIRWQEVLQDNLQRVGFEVDTVATSAEVREQLVQNNYHLIILDIRLDEADQTNTEGMELLKELNQTLGSSAAIVMLSGYGTKEQMREAFRDYKVADFLEKQHFDNIKFRRQIQEMFGPVVSINLNLNIFWQEMNGPEDVVRSLRINGQRIEADTPRQARIAIELDDLLCRLFDDAKNLIIKPMTPGYSGAGVLWAQPFYDNGGGQAVVVKFGDVHKINKEYHNFEEHIRPFVGGGRRTAVLNLQRTARLGGIVYSLLGARGDQENFGNFYRRAALAEIETAIDGLFRDTCGAWYANPGRLQPHYLTADYEEALGFKLSGLDQIIKDDLKSVKLTDRVHFGKLNVDRSFKNPIRAVTGKHLVHPTYICTTHGDLNEHNILVDQVGQIWLIDFQKTGPGHILRDVTNLDAVVRFQLLLASEATLEERLAMEETLGRIERFSQIEQATADFSTDNPALAKAYKISIHLRRIARQLVAQNPNDDFKEYHIASLYHALNHIRFAPLAPEQREHALLSASLLADRLNL